MLEFEIDVWWEDTWDIWRENIWIAAVYQEDDLTPVWFEQFDTELEAREAAEEYIKEQQHERS